ncbi:MAG: hypothetical protein PUE87_00010 [Subdoligranulum variabile]|nr:hypothetical protein [Subdoligranulum variabile]MDD6648348.1 hypothetical protein [Subdoligranulum variabile]
MKRIISVFLAAAICTVAMSIALTACSVKSTDSTTTTPESTSTSTVTETAEDAAGNAQIPAPITDRASLDEVNEVIGSAMKRPADLELTNEAWSTIDDEEKNHIGQYTFTYNGGSYTLRAAKDTGDISGVWENGTTLGNGREGDVTAITTESGGIWSRWFDGDMQYSLYAEGATMDDYTAVRAAMA